MTDTETFWEELYLSRAGGANIWSGKVNAQLAAAVEGLLPGRALDLGCGEGGDTVHLARLGWQVTAVDVSPTALSRTREMAASAGVSSLVTTERHDLASSFPVGRFDLVVATFFQSPLELAREEVLHRAAESLDPAGTWSSSSTADTLGNGPSVLLGAARTAHQRHQGTVTAAPAAVSQAGRRRRRGRRSRPVPVSPGR